MDPGVVNITVSEGASWRRKFTLMGPGALPEDPPVPIDLTGCEARAEIRPVHDSPILWVSVNEVPSVDGYIVIGGALGTLDVYFSPVATQRMEGQRRGEWDLFIEWPNGEDVDKAVKGKVTIDPSVTDPTYD